jgi:hypothetical protein
MRYSQNEHRGDRQSNRNGRCPPKARKEHHGDAADEGGKQIAPKHIGRLRKGTLRLAEYQHSRRTERRYQHRNAGYNRQCTNNGHTDHGACARFQVPVPVALWLVTMNEMPEMSAHIVGISSRLPDLHVF